MDSKSTLLSKIFFRLFGVISLSILASCGIPDFEKEFASKHNITLKFLGSHHSEESILGGFSGRMYAYKGRSWCSTGDGQVQEHGVDGGEIFKKYKFDPKKACLLLDYETKDGTNSWYVIADDNKIYFLEQWI